MPKWDRPGHKTVNVEIRVLEYEALALIGREGRLPVDEVIVRLMRAGLEAMAVKTGVTTEMLADDAWGRGPWAMTRTDAGTGAGGAA